MKYDLGKLITLHGRLPQTYQVKCGLGCGKRLTITTDGSRKAEDLARDHGWQHREISGWICWECKEAE